jgi:hypothetical protein
MTKPMVKIVNAETGEEIEREMNAAEFKQYEKDQESATEVKAEQVAKDEAKAALLTRLGITAEEASLLLG